MLKSMCGIIVTVLLLGCQISDVSPKPGDVTENILHGIGDGIDAMTGMDEVEVSVGPTVEIKDLQVEPNTILVGESATVHARFVAIPPDSRQDPTGMINLKQHNDTIVSKAFEPYVGVSEVSWPIFFPRSGEFQIEIILQGGDITATETTPITVKQKLKVVSLNVVPTVVEPGGEVLIQGQGRFTLDDKGVGLNVTYGIYKKEERITGGQIDIDPQMNSVTEFSKNIPVPIEAAQGDYKVKVECQFDDLHDSAHAKFKVEY